MKPRESIQLWGAGLLLWIFASASALTIAWLILGFLYVIGRIPLFTELLLPLQLALSILSGVILGSIVGGIQRVVLCDYVKWAQNWLSGTSVGWGIAGGLCWVEYFVLGGDRFYVDLEMIPVVLLFVGALTGAAIGSSQWLIIYRSSTISPWWILISSVSWALGASVGYAASVVKDFGIFTYLILVFVTGMLVDLMTGVALYFSLLQPPANRT